MKQQVDCYDNAIMTSLWATLKKELVQHAKFKTRAQASSSIFEWIEVWYQRERSHSSLGSLSPEQFEAARRVGSYDCVSTESGEFQTVRLISEHIAPRPKPRLELRGHKCIRNRAQTCCGLNFSAPTGSAFHDSHWQPNDVWAFVRFF